MYQQLIYIIDMVEFIYAKECILLSIRVSQNKFNAFINPNIRLQLFSKSSVNLLITKAPQKYFGAPRHNTDQIFNSP